MFSEMFSFTSNGNSKPGAIATWTALADLSSGAAAVVISFSTLLPVALHLHLDVRPDREGPDDAGELLERR